MSESFTLCHYKERHRFLLTLFQAIFDEFGRPCSDRLAMTEGSVLIDKLKHMVTSWKDLSCSRKCLACISYLCVVFFDFVILPLYAEF